MNEFDKFAKDYHHLLDHPLRKMVDSSGDYFIQTKCDILIELIDIYLKNTSDFSLLDAGCGIGDFERLFPKLNCRKVGIDLSEEMINVAKNYNAKDLADFQIGDLRMLSLPDNSIDLSFVSCVLHHMSEKDIILSLHELQRVTKYNGIIVCFEHNPLNPLTQLVVKSTFLDKGVKLLAAKNTEKLFRVIGIEVVETKYFLFGTKQIDQWLKTNFERKLDNLSIGAQYCVIGRNNNAF